jgi:hypothetical protein
VSLIVAAGVLVIVLAVVQRVLTKPSPIQRVADSVDRSQPSVGLKSVSVQRTHGNLRVRWVLDQDFDCSGLATARVDLSSGGPKYGVVVVAANGECSGAVEARRTSTLHPSSVRSVAVTIEGATVEVTLPVDRVPELHSEFDWSASTEGGVRDYLEASDGTTSFRYPIGRAQG